MRIASCLALSLSLAACSDIKTDHHTAAKPASEHYNAEGWTAKTLPDLATALESGDITSAQLTESYIDRIEAVDRAGPKLQSVLALNPDAIAQAKASDARRASGEAIGPLDGLPILLKDNIETLDPVATTAGAYALSENVTGRDSPLVAGLRDQGAVILGKTNLSQWANFRSNDSVSPICWIDRLAGLLLALALPLQHHSPPVQLARKPMDQSYARLM